ncbi:hypothetical protein F5880DRAFT_1610533 [Lentinula raphanica]|nr:hypothetical protein F5880DRAFT_1610533 [Lentinula raphanica]
MNDPDTLPLNYENYCLHPELLTRFSDSASVLQPFDGRVGALLENNYLITSPNSNVLFAPPLSPQRVRLRRDLHFFHDDPLFYPQPFDELRPHLPLIWAPSNDPGHPFAAAWVLPSEKHFDEAGDMLYNMGILDNTFYLRIKTLADTVLKSINSNNHEVDVYLCQGALQVERMLKILQMAASYEDIRVRVATLQRNILELDARVRYLSQRLAPAVHESSQDPVCLDVIGAFTDKLAILDTLCNLGIPVCSQIIRLPSGLQLDGTDADPNHKVVWEGLSTKPERYAAMNSYLQSLLDQPSAFGSNQSQSVSFYQGSGPMQASLHYSTSRATLNQTGSRQPHSRLATRPMPYHKKPQLQPQKQKNPSFPPPWSRALALHSTSTVQPPEIAEPGYFLPPPRLIDGPINATTRSFYYRNWLKIRPVILHNLNGLETPVRLSAKRWRCLLDVVGGYPSKSGQSEPTKNSTYRAEMRPLLEKLIQKKQPRIPTIDITDPTPQIEEFHGQLVDCRIEPPSREIASQILWEICEISFRQELVALDRHLDDSGLSLPKRDAMLNMCWRGSRYQADITDLEGGLAASDIQKRTPYIRALHQLMRSWRGNKPDELFCAFPNNPETHNYSDILVRIEQALANFYTTSFLATFGRAASVPHCRLDTASSVL